MGGSSTLRPGHISPGGWGVLPRRWLLLKEGLQGAVAPNGPGTPAIGGWRVLPRRWLVLKEGLQGAATPNGPGTLARGDGESCPGGGWCSRRACGG